VPVHPHVVDAGQEDDMAPTLALLLGIRHVLVPGCRQRRAGAHAPSAGSQARHTWPSFAAPRGWVWGSSCKAAEAPCRHGQQGGCWHAAPSADASTAVSAWPGSRHHLGAACPARPLSQCRH